MNTLRVVFFGTAELARASLAALHECSAVIIQAVVTQPDRPKGRDMKLKPTPVKEEALKRGLHVLQPEKARAEAFVAQLREQSPDLIVVAAYGQILPKSILDLPRHGCLNVHTSLLPRYRGAAPIQWAILNGDAETGVTIMRMDPGLDTGDILTQRAIRIEDSDTAQTLHDRLAKIGAELLMETIPGHVDGSIQPRRQPEQGSTYARKIAKEDGRIDWARPARSIWNQVRGLVPWPGAQSLLTTQSTSLPLKIWQAEPLAESGGKPGEILRAGRDGLVVACGEGSLKLLQVQREGGKRLTGDQFLAGCRVQPGDTFSQPQAAGETAIG